MTPPAVLVVGAGPAGCVAAIVLARAGVRVRLVDRAAFPRDKLCGDTLNPGALALLDRLGLGRAVRRMALPVTGMTVTGPRGGRVVADYASGLCGAALRRRELDQLLLESAAAAGVCVESGVMVRAPVLDAAGCRVVGVRLRASGGEHSLAAAAVIAADGRASKLASALRLASWAPGPRRWAFGAYYEGVEGLTTHGEMHLRAGAYLGLALVPGGAVNVCAVREGRDGRGDGPGDAYRVIADRVSADPALRARFARARPISGVTALGPLAVDARGAGRPGLLLAGDAAGFIDPMTGDGMRFALRGGELAAEAAMRELTSGEPAFRSLSRARQREFGAKWRIDRALRALAGSAHALDLAEALATRWTAPVRHLIGVAGDVPLARKWASHP